MFPEKSLFMRNRDFGMCLHWPNNGSSWENAYVYFKEFPQYEEFFAYDTMKACSLRRYFDGLTVLHLAYR